MARGRKFKGKIDEMGRECTGCGVYKTWNNFHKSGMGDYRHPQCAECRSHRASRWRAEKGESLREGDKNRMRLIRERQDPDTRKMVLERDKDNRRRRRERMAGVPRTDVCQICLSSSDVVYDHDHQTGSFRGWLCSPCNSALGFFKDSVKTLAAAIEYLSPIPEYGASGC